MSKIRSAWQAYRLRWKRRELLWRAIWAGRHLRSLADRTDAIQPDHILAVTVLRNEILHLPEFLSHYRALGVGHFLMVDNLSTDGSDLYLAKQPDVSVWQCAHSYRGARFGLDWAGALLMRYGHGHWCLSVDADELLVYPYHDSRPLPVLTAHLDHSAQPAFGALMLDLYPRGPLGSIDADADAPLYARLPWFDSGPYRAQRMMPRHNLWVQGGVRDRVFFPHAPQRAPTLNKLPLIRWHWRYAYVNSTHSVMPAFLNDFYNGPGDCRLSGVLLHAKFLPDILAKSTEELTRSQRFANPAAYVDYHQAVAAAPVLWSPDSQCYQGWQHLVDLGLMGAGEWQKNP